MLYSGGVWNVQVSVEITSPSCEIVSRYPMLLKASASILLRFWQVVCLLLGLSTEHLPQELSQECAQFDQGQHCLQYRLVVWYVPARK